MAAQLQALRRNIIKARIDKSEETRNVECATRKMRQFSILWMVVVAWHGKIQTCT